MNYIAEINRFYDWLETNSLSTSAIVLWHSLMHINNKCGWIKEFGVATSVLCTKTGLSERTIRNARNELKQKARIDWKSRGGNRAATYQLLSLTATDADNVTAIASDTLSDSASDNASALNKLNYTKQSIYLSGEEKILTDHLAKTLGVMLRDQSYLELLCMNNQIHSMEQMQNYIKTFFVELASRGEVYKDLQDAKKHFANWLKIKLNNYENNKRGDRERKREGKFTQEEWTNQDTAEFIEFANSITIG